MLGLGGGTKKKKRKEKEKEANKVGKDKIKKVDSDYELVVSL